MNDDELKKLDIFIQKVYKNEEKFSRWLMSRNNICVSYCVAPIARISHSELLSETETESNTSFTNSLNEVQIDDTLKNRIKQINYSDKFQPFLMYLMNSKHLNPVDVYKGALMDRKAFSKIKSDEDYHPKKLTALCLCIGLKLNIDQSKDLLNRAGYSFSAADLTDIIFLYFIESANYDIYAIDEALLYYKLPTITKMD